MRATLILFEGASRLGASLADMAAVLGPRPAAVARELTKLHETVVRGDLDALAADPALAAPKGEVVVVIGPPAERRRQRRPTPTRRSPRRWRGSRPAEAAARGRRAPLGLRPPRRSIAAPWR